MSSVCLHCKEPINPEARRCPSCHAWQSRWAGDAGNPRFELVVGACGLALIIGLAVVWIMISNRHDSAAGSSCHPTQVLSTTALSFRVDEASGRPLLVISGEMSNQADVAWIHPFVQVELYDAEDQLLESFPTRVYALVVPPRGRARFRIVDSVVVDNLEACARCEVRVTWADPIAGY